MSKRHARLVLAGLVAAIPTALLPSLARADKMDPALERLVKPVDLPGGGTAPCADRGTFRGTVGKCQPDDLAFAKLVNQLGAVIAPTAMHSGRTTGYGGFHVGLEGAFTAIDSGADYWKDGTRGPVDPSSKQFSVRNPSPSSTMGVYSLKVRKGFPFGLEITGQLGFIGQTTLFTGGADIRMSLLEGFRRGGLGYLPDLAVGGGVRTLTGTPQMNITVASFDAQISKPIPLADSSIVIPYAGYQQLFIFGDSGLIDSTPNTDALGACGYSGTNQPGNADPRKKVDGKQYYDGQPVCAAGGTPLDFNNNVVFNNVRVQRGRLVLGAAFRFETVFLGGQLATDLFAPDAVGGRDNETKLAGVPKQTSFAFEVGAHFLAARGSAAPPARRLLRRESPHRHRWGLPPSPEQPRAGCVGRRGERRSAAGDVGISPSASSLCIRSGKRGAHRRRCAVRLSWPPERTFRNDHRHERSGPPDRCRP